MIFHFAAAAWHYLTVDPAGQCLGGGLIAVAVLCLSALGLAGR